MDASRLKAMDARSICVIKPSALGDVVQTLPLLPLLKERFEGAKISWVINHSFRSLLEDYPLIDELISYHRRGGIRSWWEMGRQLRRGKYDLVLDLQGLARTALMSLSTGSGCVVGLETAREGSSLACHYTIPRTGKEVPAWKRYEPVAEALGCPLRERSVVFQERELQGEAKILGPDGSYVGIQLGAMWETKRWPPSKFAEVAVRVLSETNATIVLLGSPADRPLVEEFHSQVHHAGGLAYSERIIDLCGKTSLAELPSVLKRLDLLVTNDTGPMHLADVLGIPIVGIFTCTSPVRSGPKPGPGRELFFADVPCRGSYCKRCPHEGVRKMACFATIDPHQVATATLAILANSSRAVA